MEYETVGAAVDGSAVGQPKYKVKAKRKPLEVFMNALFFLCGMVAVAFVLIISIYLVISGLPAILEIGPINFLFGTRWYASTGDFGIFAIILTSIAGTAGAILIGVPIGLMTAIFLAKVANPKLAKVVHTAVELLAGIPSVVYGLVGMILLVPAIRVAFGLPSGATLLAAILRRIIETGGRNVSTYEAPIEFDFDAVPSPGGPVSQSTIPEHLKSFLTATRNSTRTAPDVVLIGESRDPDTLRGMMESAEIGVAAYSTVHTRSVPETLSRIINVFPFAERTQITATLLSCLRLVISQRLLPLPDNSGRIALREYLAFTPDIRETLLDTPVERLIQQTENILEKSGQTMQYAAEMAFANGMIARDSYLAILAERKRKEGNTHEATF